MRYPYFSKVCSSNSSDGEDVLLQLWACEIPLIKNVQAVFPYLKVWYRKILKQAYAKNVINLQVNSCTTYIVLGLLGLALYRTVVRVIRVMHWIKHMTDVDMWPNVLLVTTQRDLSNTFLGLLLLYCGTAATDNSTGRK